MATEFQSITQKMSGKQIDWEFLKELECPVCGEYMASPIKMCENGHNICGVCKERLPECPTCRGKFINVRNIALESLQLTPYIRARTRKLDVKRRSHWTTEININQFVCTGAKNVLPVY